MIGIIGIDMQNTFCAPGASLYVPNAEKHMETFARSVSANCNKIDMFHLTFDSHQRLHIAHQMFWTNKKGEHPAIFSTISEDDIVNRVWFPVLQDKRVHEYVLWYVRQLKASKNKFDLTIWPEHGIVYKPEWNLFPAVSQIVSDWEDNSNNRANLVTKGNSIWTEHYSPLKAEVVLDGNNALGLTDESTFLNIGVPKALMQCKKVGIAGEAMSHCVRFGVEDLDEYFGESARGNLFLLEDCCGPVTGFEQATDEWLHEKQKNGLNVVTIDKFWRA